MPPVRACRPCREEGPRMSSVRAGCQVDALRIYLFQGKQLPAAAAPEGPSATPALYTLAPGFSLTPLRVRSDATGAVMVSGSPRDDCEFLEESIPARSPLAHRLSLLLPNSMLTGKRVAGPGNRADRKQEVEDVRIGSSRTRRSLRRPRRLVRAKTPFEKAGSSRPRKCP
jgi:hypothetical protein